jgi:hypothetical protein
MDQQEKRLIGKKQRWSKSYTQYWVDHPWCEVCGDMSSAPAHIKSRGSGGDDSKDNLISFCLPCHTRQHLEGWGWVKFSTPHLRRKLDGRR